MVGLMLVIYIKDIILQIKMKLVFVYFWGDEGCSGTSHIPFEYESKEQFLFDVFEKYKSFNWSVHSVVEVLGCYLNKSEFENLEHDIYTIDKWFELWKEVNVL